MAVANRLAADLIILDEIARFLTVALAGFILNVIVLWLLHSKLQMNLIEAEIIGSLASIQLSFILHNSWTYRVFHKQPIWSRLLKFNVAASIGALLNLIILLWLVNLYQIEYLAALTIGGSVNIIWNFLINRLVIWRHPKR